MTEIMKFILMQSTEPVSHGHYILREDSACCKAYKWWAYSDEGDCVFVLWGDGGR